MNDDTGEIVLVCSDVVGATVDLLVGAGLVSSDDIRTPLVIGSAGATAFGTAEETLFLGHELRRFGFVREAQQTAEAERMLTLFGVDAAPSTPVSELDATERLLLVCGQALIRRARIVFVDGARLAGHSEYSEHPDPRIERALALLRDTGIRVFVIGGPFPASATIADRVVAIRAGAFAGEVVASAPGAGFRAADLDRVIDVLARPDAPEPAEAERTRAARPGESLLTVDDWTVATPFGGTGEIARSVSFAIDSGEVVVLIGDGSAELMMSLFAGSFGTRTAGSVVVGGVRTDELNPERSMRAGLAYATEHPLGFDVNVIGGLPTRVSSESLEKLARIGIVDSRREYIAERRRPGSRGRRGSADPAPFTAALEGWAQALESGSPTLPVTGMPVPRAVLLDDPLASDRAGRLDIIARLADAGAAVGICVSSVDDALAIADRVLVIGGGRIRARLGGDALTRHAVLEALIG